MSALTADKNELPYSYYDDLRQSTTANFTPLVVSGGSVDQDCNDGQLNQCQSSNSHVGRNLHSVSVMKSNNNEQQASSEGLFAAGGGGQTEDEQGGQTEEYIMCHIPTFFRWSQASSSSPSGYNDVSSEAYGGSSAALMAIHHFNNGIGTIAPSLTNIHKTCPIRLTLETVDSQSSGIVAVQELTRLVTRSPKNGVAPQPCAIMGSSWSGTTKFMGINTGVFDLLQVTPSASSVDLDNMVQYPLFARTHPSDASMAELSIDYLHRILGVRFFAEIYIDNDFGNAYHTIVTNTAAKYGMVVKSVSLRPGADEEEVRKAIKQLKEIEYSYFLGVFFAGDYEKIMSVAGELGVAGPGKLWVFNGALSSSFVNGVTALQSDSNAAKATYGSAIIHDEGGLPGLPQYDKFLEQWRGIPDNPELLQYINSKQPAPPPGSNLTFEREGDFFLQRPSHIAAFSYDAVVGLGLSACQAWKESSNSSEIFSGASHHASFVKNRFDGASGSNEIGPNTYSRNATSTYHVMSNILPDGGIDDEGMQTFSAIPKFYYDIATKEWTRYGDAKQPFVYSDGSSNYPSDVADANHDMNLLSPAVRGFCLALSGVAMLASIGFLVFTVIKRDTNVIKAAQPPFLVMLCFGCFLMAATIIPASIDDAVASSHGCSIACMSKVWLFSIGFCVSFSALFSKLNRINTLFKKARGFKRVQVGVKDVIVPFLVLITMNITVLITWTAHSPLKWERTVDEYDQYGRPSISSGQCQSEHSVAFISTLLGINAIALIYALFQAYQARNITTEFSESTHIAYAMVCIFESLFVGIPVLVIVRGNTTAEMFMQTAIVFIVVASLLLLIFVPKILAMKRGAEGLPSSAACPTCGRNTMMQQSSRWGLSSAQQSSRWGLSTAQQSSRWGLQTTSTQPSTRFHHQPSSKPLASSPTTTTVQDGSGSVENQVMDSSLSSQSTSANKRPKVSFSLPCAPNPGSNDMTPLGFSVPIKEELENEQGQESSRKDESK